MRGMGMAVLALMVPGIAQAQDTGLGWLAGKWCTAPGPRQTCEQWNEAGGTMTGVSTMVKDGETVGSERMSIAPVAGVLTFTAQPSDAAAPTSFALASRGPAELVFVNAAHDYPQRIRYWREGEVPEDAKFVSGIAIYFESQMNDDDWSQVKNLWAN